MPLTLVPSSRTQLYLTAPYPLSAISVYSVKDYGAAGNGTTDDTTACQAAITAASAAGGGIVWFPRGIYLLSTTLTVPSFVTLQGVSAPFRATEYGIDPSSLGSMITGPAVTTFTLVANSDSSGGNASIVLRDLWIGVGSSTVADVTAVDFNKVRRSLIEGCYLRGAVTTNRYGLRYRGASEHCWVVRCWFEGCGIKSDSSSNSLMVEDCEVAQGGIDLGGGFDHIVRGCDVYQDGIAAGVAYPAYPFGIKLRGVEGAQIYSNHVNACREHGIYLAATCVENHIKNNSVKNCSQETADTWSGICLNSDSAVSATTNNVVIGNRCFDNASKQKYGIQLVSDSGTQTNGNLIVGNVLANNHVGGLNVATAGMTNTIRDNTGFVTEATGSASKQNGSTITHGLSGTPTSVHVNSAVAKHIAAVTSVGSTTFTISLHDDTGAAVVVNETVYWSATHVPA